MLTAKQERFVQELIKGKSQREAYKSSYDASRMLDKTIDNRAYVLFKKSEIRARYDELRAEVDAKTSDDAVSMRAFIIEQYKKIASGAIRERSSEYDSEGKLVKTKNTIKASDVASALNKLAEYYGVTPEVNVQHDVTVTFADDLKGYGD